MVAHLIIMHYIIITNLVHITHKPDILRDPDITFTFIFFVGGGGASMQ